MKRRLLILFLLIFLLLCACGKNTPADETAIRPAAEDRDNRDLILAACGLSNHEQDVLKFNQENTQGIHITIENYAQGTTAEQALRRLNMELSSGAGPDLIDLETFPVLEIYSRQGLLLELSEYLKRDLSPDDFYAMDILSEEGLFALPSGFSVMTCYGLPAVFGEKPGWSFEDYSEILQTSQQQYAWSQTNRDFLQFAYVSMMPRCVDWDHKVCSYDQEAFKALLELAAQMPDSLQYSAELQVGNGRLLYREADIGSPFDIRDIEKQEGGPVCMIGYPTADGSCGSYLYFHSLTGVNAFSQKPELAWEYLKYMVSGERYHGNLNWGGTIPLKKNYTEELLQHLRNPYAEYEGKSIVVNQDGTFTVDGILMDAAYDPSPMINEHQEQLFRDLLERTTTRYAYDPVIYQILEHETSKYFSGASNIDETIAAIQAKVSVYLAELG